MSCLAYGWRMSSPSLTPLHEGNEWRLFHTPRATLKAYWVRLRSASLCQAPMSGTSGQNCGHAADIEHAAIELPATEPDPVLRVGVDVRRVVTGHRTTAVPVNHSPDHTRGENAIPPINRHRPTGFRARLSPPRVTTNRADGDLTCGDRPVGTEPVPTLIHPRQPFTCEAHVIPSTLAELSANHGTLPRQSASLQERRIPRRHKCAWKTVDPFVLHRQIHQCLVHLWEWKATRSINRKSNPDSLSRVVNQPHHRSGNARDSGTLTEPRRSE